MTAISKYQHRPFYELWSPDSTEYHGHQMMDLQWQHGGQDTLKTDGFDSFKNVSSMAMARFKVASLPK